MSGATSEWSRVACAAIALALLTATACADPRAGDEHCTREDVQNSEPDAALANEHDGETSAAIAAEASRQLPSVNSLATEMPASPHHVWWPAHFADHLDFGTRLKALRRLRLLRLFDNTRVTVFFGVDRAGVAGLHIQQQDPNDLPSLAVNAGPIDVPPLRAVPLSSP